MESVPRAGGQHRRSRVVEPVSRATRQTGCTATDPPSHLRARRSDVLHVAGKRVRTRVGTCVVLASCAVICACATPDAPDVSGRWRPVNRFAEAPQAIPLQQAYVFQASPVDGTLKAMLARWARDGGVSLHYRHRNDYTLHAPVARIRTPHLQEAATALTLAYAGQGLRVVAGDSTLAVEDAVADDRDAERIATQD